MTTILQTTNFKKTLQKQSIIKIHHIQRTLTLNFEKTDEIDDHAVAHPLTMTTAILHPPSSQLPNHIFIFYTHFHRSYNIILRDSPQMTSLELISTNNSSKHPSTPIKMIRIMTKNATTKNIVLDGTRKLSDFIVIN